jgi:hypothetical protein
MQLNNIKEFKFIKLKTFYNSNNLLLKYINIYT